MKNLLSRVDCHCAALLVLLAACAARGGTAPDPALHEPPPASAQFSADAAAPFVRLALECAAQEYPNKIAHTMASDADQGTPRSLHPAFYGCFDWHSSVHGHWLLVRFARTYPGHELAAEARTVLAEHLTPERIAVEAAYVAAPERASWERPYGLAWLLQLAAELHEWDTPEARNGSEALRPLERICVDRIETWLPKLGYPIRTGEHSQTAFAFGMILDYAATVDDADLAELVERTSRRLYLDDRGALLRFEPSGQDFLSPALAEADLMRRVLSSREFAGWLRRFLPELDRADGRAWLPVARVTDRTDGKLAHLDGLNLSRAWMLEGIAGALPAGDDRRAPLRAAADAHRTAGLDAVTGEHYAGGHWLGTYAMYLVTGRGIR